MFGEILWLASGVVDFGVAGLAPVPVFFVRFAEVLLELAFKGSDLLRDAFVVIGYVGYFIWVCAFNIFCFLVANITYLVITGH